MPKFNATIMITVPMTADNTASVENMCALVADFIDDNLLEDARDLAEGSVDEIGKARTAIVVDFADPPDGMTADAYGELLNAAIDAYDTVLEIPGVYDLVRAHVAAGIKR